jgi:hypothetical protein
MVKVVAFSLVNELNPRQRPVSWLAVVSQSAFPGLQGKSSGRLDRECRLQLRGQLRHRGHCPAPHSRFTFWEGTDDGRK